VGVAGLNAREIRLVAAIQAGLPLVSRPYAVVGEAIGMREDEVIACIRRMCADGIIKRLGIVVRHHELGYAANAMVVWDVPDAGVAVIGNRMGQMAFVTLCYRRPRRLPDWPYNLFCMIHGKDRQIVMRNIQDVISYCRLDGVPYEVLFSRKRYKQHGARYVAPGHTVDAVCGQV